MAHPLSRQFCNPEAGQRFTVNQEEYILEGELGDGAAGVVRKARRVRDGSPRAVKFLCPDPKYIDENIFDDVAARFRREGQRGPHLDHPSLVKVFDYCRNVGGLAFESSGPQNPFILMQAVKGKTLESYIRRLQRRREEKNGALWFDASSDRLSLAIHVACALTYLHSKKLVHRDVKPANIFIPEGDLENPIPRAILGDFGIMKWGDFHASVSSGTLTVTSQKGLGALKYMSPEQAIAPRDVTIKSDIYSFGITLFELFTGEILASPHHVFEIYNARMARGTSVSRFQTMSCHLSDFDADLGEILLDMHLRGARGRSPIDKIFGRLKWEYEQRVGKPWEE